MRMKLRAKFHRRTLASGRLLVERMRRYVNDGESFAVETACAGKSYIPTLKACKTNGWKVSLYYFWLPAPELSIDRVAKRVLNGGHPIPDEVIYRRFTVGLSNMLKLYLPLADEAKIYDNSESRRILIAERVEGSELVIYDHERWSGMEEIVR
jgi:predicted ABC-type ATPase